ncbi:MAG: hypothetical protein QOH60_2339 [Mycobacterium sp.]|jgi:hypothetical protein|nr:hypothetical protein [Mycobacterium sp.]
MTQKFLLALALTAISAAVVLIVSIFPSAESRSDPAPPCSVRSAQSNAPSAKATAFAGGDAQSTSVAPLPPAAATC